MSFIELLRSARSSRISVLHKFLTSYDPATERVYGFVEGEADQNYYRLHLQKHAPTSKDVYVYNCDGKENVYRAYEGVVALYPNCTRVLFFVDKDVDEIIGKRWPADPRIFVTNYYSIENYVVCREALTHYFQNFMKVRRVDVEVDAALAQFDEQLIEFHQLVLPIMGWIVVARRTGHWVRLHDINLSELLSFSDAGLSRRPRRRALAYLRRVTQVLDDGPIWRQIRTTCLELKRLPAKTYVRGKFEAWWFINFGRRIAESIQKVVGEAGGSVSFSMQLTESTFVQLLGSCGPAPPELDRFMSFHLDRPALPLPDLRRQRVGFFRRLLGLLK